MLMMTMTMMMMMIVSLNLIFELGPPLLKIGKNLGAIPFSLHSETLLEKLSN